MQRWWCNFEAFHHISQIACVWVRLLVIIWRYSFFFAKKKDILCWLNIKRDYHLCEPLWHSCECASVLQRWFEKWKKNSELSESIMLEVFVFNDLMHFHLHTKQASTVEVELLRNKEEIFGSGRSTWCDVLCFFFGRLRGDKKKVPHTMDFKLDS